MAEKQTKKSPSWEMGKDYTQQFVFHSGDFHAYKSRC